LSWLVHLAFVIGFLPMTLWETHRQWKLFAQGSEESLQSSS